MASRKHRNQSLYDSDYVPDYRTRSLSNEPLTPGSHRHYTLEGRVEETETELHDLRGMVEKLTERYKELQADFADLQQWHADANQTIEDLEKVRDVLRNRPEVLSTLEKLSPHVDGLMELISNCDSRRNLEPSDLSEGKFHTIKENLSAIYPSADASKAFTSVINIENLDTICKLPEAIIVLLHHGIDAMDWKFADDLRTDTASYLFKKFKQDHDGVSEDVIKLATDTFHELMLMLEKDKMTLNSTRQKWISFNQKYHTFLSGVRNKLSMVEEQLLQPVAGDELAAKLTASATLQSKGISTAAVTAAAKISKDLVDQQRENINTTTLQQQVQAQGYVMIHPSKLKRWAKRSGPDLKQEQDEETPPTKRPKKDKPKQKGKGGR